MADNFSKLPPGAVVQPCPVAEQEQPGHWIEIELLGEDDQPQPWEEYLVKLPDGRQISGYLDGEGVARLDCLPTAGQCLVSFPALDRDAWDFIAPRSTKPPSA
jgi:hypothetical protein